MIDPPSSISTAEGKVSKMGAVRAVDDPNPSEESEPAAAAEEEEEESKEQTTTEGPKDSEEKDEEASGKKELPIFDYSGVAALQGEITQLVSMEPHYLHLAAQMLQEESDGKFLLRSSLDNGKNAVRAADDPNPSEESEPAAAAAAAEEEQSKEQTTTEGPKDSEEKDEEVSGKKELPISDYSGVAALPGETTQFVSVEPRYLHLAAQMLQEESDGKFLLRSSLDNGKNAVRAADDPNPSEESEPAAAAAAEEESKEQTTTEGPKDSEDEEEEASSNGKNDAIRQPKVISAEQWDLFQQLARLHNRLHKLGDDSDLSPDAARALDDLDQVLTMSSDTHDPAAIHLSAFYKRCTSSISGISSPSVDVKPDKVVYNKQFSKPMLVVWNPDKKRYEWKDKSTPTRTNKSTPITPKREEETKISEEEEGAVAEPNSNNPAFLRLMELLALHGQAAMESAKTQVKEAERVLFFTDVPDRAVASQDDNPALLQFRERMSQLELEFAKQMTVIAEQTQEAYKEAERAVFFTDLPNPAFSELQQLELAFAKKLAVVAEQTHEAYKEAERIVFFTDLPDDSVARQEDAPALLQLLSQMELAFAKQLAATGEQTYQAFKQVERTLLFTDVPDNLTCAPPRAPTSHKVLGMI